MKKVFGIALVFMALSQWVLAQTGTIRGTITDKETGETLIGVNVYIQDPFIGTITDLNGAFTLDNVPAGAHTVVISYVSYTTQNIEGVNVQANDVTILDVPMTAESFGLKEVVVQAKVLDNTENAILAMQKKSLSVQDGISSQELSKIGAGDAAESVKYITGVSIVDGKYINVRGLGDRYSGAQLNGVTLASTDPNSNSAQLDIIPANLLDNIITSKTFTPDQPGDFTGGNVNMKTKSFPEQFTMQVSTSLSYNDVVTGNSNFLTHEGGNLEWLGYDDGSRSLPEVLQPADTRALLTPGFYIKARGDQELANLLDQTAKSVSPAMAPTNGMAGPNHGFSLSFGNQYKVAGKPLGVLMGGSYKRSFGGYFDGTFANWDLTGAGAQEMFNYFRFNDNRNTDNPSISALANLSYRLAPKHEIGVNFIYNHDAVKASQFMAGPYPGIISASNNEFQTRALHFMERGMRTAQVRGKHVFESLRKTEVEWIGGYTRSFQNEPDLRLFANEYDGAADAYFVRVSEYDRPSHFFRDLTDDSYEFKGDITIPLGYEGAMGKLKLGGNYKQKDRVSNEDRFRYNWVVNNANEDLYTTYQGDAMEFFGPQNTGIIGFDSSRNRFLFGNYLVDESLDDNDYTGTEQITAGYGMLVYELSEDLKFIGGLRGEGTFMQAQSADTTLAPGEIKRFDLLPSVNLIYSMGDNMNIRLAGSRTIARPTMREMSPFSTYDFIGGALISGNPNLDRSLVYNVDLRWEWFVRPGEIIAVSGFYKNFQDPIVRLFIPRAANQEITWINTNDATVYGVEFDFRKDLDFISPRLANFRFGMNFTYTYSEVALDPEEYETLVRINPEIQPTRPFNGQSPYLVNTMLNYKSDSLGLEMTLNLNVFGARLSEIGFNGVPDIYEQPRPMLNFNLMKDVGERFQVKLGVTNILNAEFKKTQTFNNQEYITQLYQIGRTYTFGLSYTIR